MTEPIPEAPAGSETERSSTLTSLPAGFRSPSRIDPLLPVAVLKTLSAHTKERYDQARADAAGDLGPGDRRIVRSPLDNAKLGAVYMTDPKPVAVVTDEPALTEWMVEHYKADTESTYDISGTTEQVIQVLFEHAPELLKPRLKLRQSARQRLLADAVSLGQPVGPGGEVDIPGIGFTVGEPVMACKPDDDALLAVYMLFQTGRLELDGTLKPEVEAA